MLCNKCKMNRLILFFAAWSLLLTSLQAQDGKGAFQIMRLTSADITIGGRALRQGDRFAGTDPIHWDDERQSMEVKELATGMLYRFSKRVFYDQGKEKSLSDYFLRTNKASTRDASPELSLWRSPVSGEFAERRLALVIGNSNYTNLSYLRNAQKDASDLASVLSALGFDVVQCYEANYTTMRTALNRFAALASDYDVVLFYFAGHGIQEDGKNYLIPVNAELEYRSELARLLSCEDVVDRMDASKAPARLVFLDACRSPKRSWARDATAGLARMEGTPGSVILFSTESGKEALDGTGDNSPFAESLLRNIVQPGRNFNETMDAVVRDTYALTDKVQFPLKVGTLISDFAFNPGGAVVESGVAAVAEKLPEAPAPGPGSSGAAASSLSSETVSGQRPAARQEPSVVKAKVPVRNLEAFATPPVRVGNDLEFTLILTNKGAQTLQPTVNRSGMALYLSDGTMRKCDYLQMGAWVGTQKAEFAFPLPASVPVAVRFRVYNVPPGVTALPLLNAAFYGLNPRAVFDSATIEVRNMQVEEDWPDEWQAAGPGDPSMSVPVRNIRSEITYAARSGSGIEFRLTLTNDNASALRSALNITNTEAFLPDGTWIKYDHMEARVGSDKAEYGFALPSGVPVAVTFRIDDVPPGVSWLPYLQLSFDGLNPSSPLSETNIVVRNFPIMP